MYLFSFIDLLPYIYIALLFIFLSIIVKSSRQLVVSKCIFIIILFFTIFRYDVGWDYNTYLELINSDLDTILHSRFEPIPKLIFYLSAKLNFFPLTFIFFGIIQLGLIYRIINNYSTDSFLSWAFYVFFPMFFLESLSIIRQFTAFLIVFYSFFYLKDAQKVKYFIAILIATMFHTTALVGLLFYPLYYMNLTKRSLWIIFIISFFLDNITFDILSKFHFDERISIYLNLATDSDHHSTSSFNYLLYLMSIILLLYYDKLVKFNTDNEQYLKFAIIGVSVFNLFIFESVMSTRLSSFFIIFWILIFPTFYNIIKSRFILVLPLLMLFFYQITNYIQGYNSGILDKISFLPYKVWFNYLQ